MRRLLAVTISAVLLAPAAAQDAAVAQPDNQLTIQPAQPPKPEPVPVPDGPVLKKTELEGGLIIEDIKIGEGYEIKADDAIVIHYHGTLKDGGKVFDSSFERGEPAAFPLSNLIQGWQKGVPGMKVGGVRRLTVPSALGYGAQGAGQTIPPNADLVFIIQIVDALQIEDVKVGEGEAAAAMSIPVTKHTVKDASGKVIDDEYADKLYVWIPGEFDAMRMALQGMKVGGKRKVRIPKEYNRNHPEAPTKRPQQVPIEMEIELVACRNLPGQ